MRKSLFLLTVLIFFNNYLFAQNSMTGDGFGGRGWYVPHNYQAGAYSAYTVCGDSNQLYSWGDNIMGELGNGTNISSNVPVPVNGMTNVKFHATGYVSVAIKSDSSAWVWGDYTQASIPSAFSYSPIEVLNNVKFADGGIGHAAFVKYDGTVWALGNNENGALGNGFSSLTPVTIPVQMTGINNAVRVAAIGSPGIHNSATIILLADGTVKITGGRGTFQNNFAAFPLPLIGLDNIIDIKGNPYVGYALKSDGSVYSFGKEGHPLLGFGGVGPVTNIVQPPTKIIFPVGAASIVALSTNNDGNFTLALDSNQNVYAWGSNRFGEIGTGAPNLLPYPVLIASDVIDIFAGENFSYILKADNTLWATGASGYPSSSLNWGSIWMNLPNIQRNVFTQIDPTIPPMNLCTPKVWGVVPIKLSNFTCVPNGNNAIINWQSAEEINADKYIVEYSKDGRNFQNIAIIATKGSNSNYNYVHQQVNGTAFYRLKMMDRDGSFTYSEIRVVKFNSKTGFTIAPSPANNVVYVFTKSNSVIKSIQIVSIDGQVVKILNKYSNGQGINISNLSKGVYILKVLYKNNEMEYGRFIKM